jgi:hypothetical protein
MKSKKNSTKAAAGAVTRLHHMPWCFFGRYFWRYLMTCPCSGRQIRHHLLIADLLVWIVLILVIALILNLA